MVQITEAIRLVDGLGGGGYAIVGSTIKGRAADRSPLFGKGTVTRIGDEIAAMRAERVDHEHGPPAVAFINTTVLPASERARLEDAWGIQLVDRWVSSLQIHNGAAPSAISTRGVVRIYDTCL